MELFFIVIHMIDGIILFTELFTNQISYLTCPLQIKYANKPSFINHIIIINTTECYMYDMQGYM